MPLLDIFKKKKKVQAEKEVKPEVKPVKKTERKPKAEKRPKKLIKKEKEIKAEAPKPPAKIPETAYQVLKTPQVTEKATALTGKNQYVFKVWPEANKVEIKKAVRDLYGVEVVSVKIIKVPRKRRRLGRISGWRKGYKKAIVRVKEGQKIEVLPR